MPFGQNDCQTISNTCITKLFLVDPWADPVQVEHHMHHAGSVFTPTFKKNISIQHLNPIGIVLYQSMES